MQTEIEIFSESQKFLKSVENLLVFTFFLAKSFNCFELD